MVPQPVGVGSSLVSLRWAGSTMLALRRALRAWTLLCVQARLQAEDLEQLPPRFRTQEESLRRLHYPSSFALRGEPGAAGLPDAVGQQLAAVSRAVAQAYPQEHLSMAALPEVGSATRTPRLGAAAAHSAEVRSASRSPSGATTMRS